MRELIVAFFVTLVIVANAFADGIPAGSDSFTVKAANVNISLPADFFNPGSDPFSGTVMLGGGSGGGTDTIIQRKGPISPLPVPAGTGTVPIEMLQLNLQSVAPITVTYSGGSPEQWNVMLMLDPSNQSLGSMTINHTDPDGGTFYSNLSVLPTIDFSPVLPVVLTRSKFFTDSLNGYSCTWTHAPPTGFPTGSNFYPGGVPGYPGQLNHLFYNGGQLDMELALGIPEPSAFVLLICGLAASLLFFFCRRQ